VTLLWDVVQGRIIMEYAKLTIGTIDIGFWHLASKASAVVSLWRERASHYCYSNTIWWRWILSSWKYGDYDTAEIPTKESWCAFDVSHDGD